MGKHCRKKKSSKHSSQVRSRKKNRKPKSKKPRSLSSSEESESYESDSSSSSREDYRRRRDKRGLRKSRKRTRRRSPSSESSESEDDSIRAKKRKRLKRKDDRSVKKRSRRSPSVSSRSNSSDENDFEKSRGKIGRKDKGKRDLEKDRRGIKRGRDRDRDRSMSSSSPRPSHDSSDGPRSEERTAAVNYSKRLRSVITIVEGEENVGLGKEGVKEEIMYDHGNYLPCRSNDSIDGGNKKGLGIDLQSPNKQVEKDDVTSSKVGGVEDTNGQDNVNVAGDIDSLEEEKDCADVDGQNVDDLENILRQRALENLLKFRGGLKNTSKKTDRSDGNIQQLSFKGADFTEVESPMEESSRVVYPVPSLERDDAVPPPNDEKPNYGFQVGKNSNSGMQDPSCTFDKGTSRTNEQVNKIAANATSKPNSLTVTESAITPKPQIAIIESASNMENSVSDAANNATTGSTITNVEEVKNASKSVDLGSSRVETPLKDPHSNEVQDYAKEGGQYDQKTMSVMRGGEMVQVSYKVYIPTKAPALARRKLKR